MKHFIQTVRGFIMPQTLGRTLTHEHLNHQVNPSVFYIPMSSPLKLGDDISLQNLAYIRQYPYSCKYNIDFSDSFVKEAVEDELHLFKKAGGGTIVENSSHGLRTEDHPHILKTLSEATGVNIIAGTGFYVEASQSMSVLGYTHEQIVKIMDDDLSLGMYNTTVRCGVIGELGCSWPLTAFERRVLQAAAEVQAKNRCPVIIHPGRNKESPKEIMQVFLEAGGCADQTVMSHLERTLFTEHELLEFASLGCYCEFDLFGLEVSHYQLNEDIDMISDAQRIHLIHRLIEEDYEDKIVISHDIHTKHRLMRAGGHGFSHILVNVVPKMLKRGISLEMVDKILIGNPSDLLTWR